MTASSVPGRRRRRSLGRRIATVIYFAFLAYIVAVGFYSIVPQVFWPRSSHATSSVGGSCAAEIRSLSSQLLERASAHIASSEPTEKGGSTRRWLLAWDDRYVAAGPRCEAKDEQTYALLGRLRHRIEDSLVRHDRLHAPLIREIDEQLARRGPKQHSENPR